MKTLFLTILLLFSCTTRTYAQNKAEIIRQISAKAQVAGIDPDFAVALATVESSLNPKAVGQLGEIGLFQLRPEYHPTISGDTNHNTEVAMRYLVSLKQKYGAKYGRAWFVLYNTGPARPPKHPTQTKYYQKVMRELGQLKFKRYIAVR